VKKQRKLVIKGDPQRPEQMTYVADARVAFKGRNINPMDNQIFQDLLDRVREASWEWEGEA